MPAPDLYSRPHAVAFLRDVIENPDDDAPRLIFADWLEDHGDSERAEFIRVQVEREKLSPYSLRSRQIRVREIDLYRRGADQWRGRLKDVTSVTTFRRGFVEAVTLTPAQLTDHFDEVRSLAPVRSVELFELTPNPQSMRTLAKDPRLRQLQALHLAPRLSDESLAEFFSRFESETLEALDLSLSGASAHLLRVLATARLSCLRALRLGGNPLSLFLGRFLADSPSFPLRELSVCNVDLREEDVQAMAGWAGLASVERLDLSFNSLGVRGTQRLAASPHLAALKHLNLDNASIGHEGARALAASADLAGLRSLGLRANALQANTLDALLGGPRLARIEVLDLADNEVGDAGAASLADWPGLSGVAVLNLGRNGLSDRGAEALLDSPHLGEPVELSFASNNLSAASIRAIANCPRLRNLHLLDLTECALTDVSVRTLVDSQCLPNLHSLWLGGANSLSDPCRKKASARFPDLRPRL